MFQTFLLLIIIQQCFCLTKLLIEQRGVRVHNFAFNKIDYWDEEECIIFGLWSKYNLFSLFEFQLTNPTCYNLINALERNSGKSNFLYYDCLDHEQKTIKKIVQYVDEKEEQHDIIIDLDIFQYENIWYYFGVSMWIIKKKFELLIMENLNTLYYQNQDVSFPFFDEHVIITFGGELYLYDQQRITTLNQNQQFSLFCGKLSYYNVQVLNNFQDQEMHIFAKLDKQIFEICSNQNLDEQIVEIIPNQNLDNLKTQFIDQNFQFINTDTKILENEICDSFSIDGWIKGIQIQQIDQEFLYKFIKISADSENEQITNDNLCPFQLLYRIQNGKLYLQILTYSYTYPSLFLDFSFNPFLIKKEFEIELQRLYLWHYLSVRKKENQLTIQITFYERENQYELNYNTQVNHFINVKSKISIGNLFQNKINYIEMKIFGLTLILKSIIQQQKNCHISCKTCQGPTKNDCLSCEQTSYRFYITETQSCVCPENLLDHPDGTCKDYEKLQFSLVEYEKSLPQCQYGYFRYDESTCLKCPSNPNSNTIFCLDCFQNPVTWKLDPICQIILLYDKSDTSIAKIEEDFGQINFFSYQYLYTDEDINLSDFEQIYIDFQQKFTFQCNYHIQIEESYQQNCNLDNCPVCEMTFEKMKCLKCNKDFQIVDEKCVFVPQTKPMCFIPYYTDSQYFCKLCTLENCLYCFEYLKTDLSKNTLYEDYNIFIGDEFNILELGCALCQEGYQFNFVIGKCIFEEPQIQNCKRSFINLEGIEVCTLADSQNFEIAPEIINCQQKIKNCYSCIQTSQQTIMCILCDDGYSSNVLSGQCQLCSIQYSKKCIYGKYMQHDGRFQLLQSFIMQFQNKNHFYQNQDKYPFGSDSIISCEDGYQPLFDNNTCEKYCNSDCLKCVEQFSSPQGFMCVECPFNYYNQPSRSTDQRNCIDCPKLCSICEPRTSDEIYKLNPYFIITQDNVQFTHKCIQKVDRNDTYLDSEVQITKLILKDLNNILNFDVSLTQYFYQYIYQIEDVNYTDIIDYQYCNQIGIDIVQITFNLESEIGYIEPRSFSHNNMIRNNLKQKIFSLKLIIFNLVGINQRSNLYSYDLITNNFDTIKITNIDFLLMDPNYFIFYNDQPIQLTIKNCTFQNKATQTFGVFNINITYSKSIEFKNLTFQNLYLIDSIIFNISGEYLQSEIIIFDITIQNCEFVNSSLISVFQNQKDIQIQNLKIVNSTFNNFNLIDVNTKSSLSQKGYFENIQFFNNQLYNCDFIKFFNFQQFLMRNIQISNNNFYNSIFLTVNSNFQINNYIIVSNFFENSTFFISSDMFLLNEIAYIFKNLQLKDNQFSKSYVFFISPYYKQDIFELLVIFQEVVIRNNLIEKSLINNTFLFQIHCNDLKLYNINITEQVSIQIIFIYDTFSTQIQFLDFTNPLENTKILMGKDCFNNFKQLQIIKIFGYNTIKLDDVQINNLNVQDLSILEFNSNILFSVNLIEKISIRNVIFQNTILLKQNIGKRMSLVYIYSEKIQTIIIDQINFHSNLLHQTADDQSESIAGLIYISSQMSNITITNFVSNNNGITNSSCSFLYFTAYSIFISNYQIDGLNIFNDQLLRRFISNSNIFKQNSKEEIQLLIQKLVSIQTKGSACYATVTELKIMNSTFQNILSYTSPLFELKTEGQGLIEFQNLAIKNVDIIYDSNLELQGSIKIYSLNSQLNLNFINVIFEQVYNKFGSSILSLTPSLRKNRIVFKNVQILNSLSLQNQIMKAEFSDKIKDFNFVNFQNVSIISTEQAWLDYFQKIGQINSEDLSKIMNDNAMINVISCTLIIENLFVEGIIQSPIIKTLNAVNLQIIQCKFFSIQTFYQFNIIQISQNKYYSMKVNIYNNEFRYLQLYQPTSEYQIQQLLLNEIKLDQKCQFDNHNLFFYFNSFSLADIFKLFQSQQNSGSLVNLQSISNQTNVRIQSLKILENKCNFCQEGLISINIQQIKKLKIKEFICIKNQIIKYGCLNIQSNQDYENQFTLEDSVFALNQGQSGIGIIFINLKGFIYRTLVFNNSATDIVGGMDVKVQDNKFLIKNTLIFQNQAKQCGGIKLNNYSNLQNENFIQSLSLFNRADNLANNIVEAPTQLLLKINDQVMQHLLEINDNVTFSILEMSAQQILQQNNIVYTNYLMIPSNQKIIDYKIFDLQTLLYIPYITEFSLYFLNSQREQLGNFEDQNCTVFQNIIKPNGALINKSELFIISFDTEQNKIDLGNLYFTFDPYKQSQYIQEIEILCKISDNQALSYKFKTKSFYCQIGEFYTNGGCQICDYKFGFYSVSYNATKCSIFDKTKFSEITSNTISLLPGFWRPDIFSDQTELCYQKQKNCLGGWSVGDSSCLQGNLGGLCYECDFYNARGDGYYFKNLDNDECSLCDNNNKNYVMQFIIVSLIALISIFMTLRSIEKTNILFNNLKVGKKFGKIIFKLNQDHESFLIKMFVNYLWIFSLIFTYNINFSVNLNIIDQASNTSFSMANNLDCYFAQLQEVNLIYIRLIATTLFIFIQLILVYIIFVLISKIQKSKFDLSNISNTSLYLYISNNAALTKQFCSLIAKKSISNIDFVQGNMALRFDSNSHQNWIYAFILPGLSINGCVIPFLLIGILFINRHQLDQIRIRKYFCYLFNEYNETNYYWEQIKIWQKTILIIIMVYFEDRLFLKTSLFGLTLIIYQFLAIYFKPYIIKSLNRLDYQAGLLCCIAIFLAATRYESNLANSVQYFYNFSCIAFLCVLLIYLYLNIIIKAYYKKYKLAALSLLLTITKNLLSQTRLAENLSNAILTEKNKRDRLIRNFDILKKQLSKVYKFNSQLRQDQTCKTDQTFQQFANKSIKFSNLLQAKE